MQQSNFKIKGMHCKSCEVLITEFLDEVGVKASVDYKKGEVIVTFDENKIKLDKIKEIIKENGYSSE